MQFESKEFSELVGLIQTKTLFASGKLHERLSQDSGLSLKLQERKLAGVDAIAECVGEVCGLVGLACFHGVRVVPVCSRMDDA